MATIGVISLGCAKNQVDTERMARILLDEFRGGKLGRFTLETVEDCGK